MRTRNVKPDFFKDEDIAALDPLFRIAYIGLWCCADRQGRLKDKPGELKAEILPHDKVNFEKILNTLASTKNLTGKCSFITRYEVDGNKYIQINKFLEHQKPHITERPSLIPSCSNGTVTVIESDSNGSENKKKKVNKQDIEEKFKIFWQAYPNKKNKGYAETVFFRIAPDKHLFNKILIKLDEAKRSIEWTAEGPKGMKGEFIPHPSSWLNAKGWDNEYRSTQKASDAKIEEMKRQLKIAQQGLARKQEKLSQLDPDTIGYRQTQLEVAYYENEVTKYEAHINLLINK